MHGGARLITSSKDGSLRVWDLALQHCSQVLTGFKGEVWSFAVNPEETRVVAGCIDTQLRVFELRSAAAVPSTHLTLPTNRVGLSPRVR